MELSWEDDFLWLDEDFINVVLDKVSILDILEHCKVDYYRASSGDFSYKARCPLPIHAEGAERTPSFYISTDQKKFYCFGCNSKSSVVDFVQIYYSLPYYKAVKWLADFANIESCDGYDTLTPRVKKNPEHTIAKYIYDAGILTRRFLQTKEGSDSYHKWTTWADKQYLKMDGFLNLDDDQWEQAKSYSERLALFLSKQG